MSRNNVSSSEEAVERARKASSLSADEAMTLAVEETRQFREEQQARQGKNLSATVSPAMAAPTP